MVGASLFAAQAASANTTVGPYPATIGWSDGGTCSSPVIWAAMSGVSVKFVVSPENFDGSYNVTGTASGTFTSQYTGPSPGSCAPDTTGGTSIVKNVKGHVTFVVKFFVTGGTFDAGATCDTNCANAFSVGNDMGPFTTAFFGAGATWTAAVDPFQGFERFTSTNTVLVHKLFGWDIVQGGFGSYENPTGDISID
jgi:hypothetical protein